MQNKANWKIDQMTVTKVISEDYNSWTLGIRGKNKAKTKPFWLFENSIRYLILTPL